MSGQLAKSPLCPSGLPARPLGPWSIAFPSPVLDPTRHFEKGADILLYMKHKTRGLATLPTFLS